MSSTGPLPPTGGATGRYAEEQGPAEPSVGALFSAASENMSTLIRGEIELAKTELSSTVRRGGIGAAMFGGAAVLGIFSITFLFVAVAEGITALGLPRWLSYLIVWAFFILVAALLVLIGLRMIKKVKAPERTIASLKEAKELLDRQPPGQRNLGLPPSAPRALPHR